MVDLEIVSHRNTFATTVDRENEIAAAAVSENAAFICCSFARMNKIARIGICLFSRNFHR